MSMNLRKANETSWLNKKSAAAAAVGAVAVIHNSHF